MGIAREPDAPARRPTGRPRVVASEAAAPTGPSMLEVHNDVIRRIFGVGLTLAAILSLERVDDEVAERLRDALGVLDTSVADLRTTALEHQTTQGTAQAEVPREATTTGSRRLRRCSVDEVFAYAVNRCDFLRAADNALWAHESDGLLLSARFGTPLARREGRIFYDLDSHAPLYFEDGVAAAPEGP